MKDEAFGKLGEACRSIRSFTPAMVSDEEAVERARTRRDMRLDS